MSDRDAKDWLSLDEARDEGVPEQVLQSALAEADTYVFGTAFLKWDADKKVWMRIDPRDVEIS